MNKTKITGIVCTLMVSLISMTVYALEYKTFSPRKIRLIENETYRYTKRSYKNPFIFYIKTDKFLSERDDVADLFAMRALVYITKRQFEKFKGMFRGDKKVPEKVLQQYFFDMAGLLNENNIEIYLRFDMRAKGERRSLFTFRETKNGYDYIVVHQMKSNKFTLVVPSTDKDFQVAYVHINKK